MHKDEIEIIKKNLLSADLNSYEKRVALYVLNGIKNSSYLDKLSKESVTRGIREILNDLSKANVTIVTESRIKREINILNKVLDNNFTLNDLVEISFEVDCLYFDMEIPPRNTDTILKYLYLKGNRPDGKNF